MIYPVAALLALASIALAQAAFPVPFDGDRALLRSWSLNGSADEGSIKFQVLDDGDSDRSFAKGEFTVTQQGKESCFGQFSFDTYKEDRRTQFESQVIKLVATSGACVADRKRHVQYLGCSTVSESELSGCRTVGDLNAPLPNVVRYFTRA